MFALLLARLEGLGSQASDNPGQIELRTIT
jgi:hypothetical protein